MMTYNQWRKERLKRNILAPISGTIILFGLPTLFYFLGSLESSTEFGQGLINGINSMGPLSLIVAMVCFILCIFSIRSRSIENYKTYVELCEQEIQEQKELNEFKEKYIN